MFQNRFQRENEILDAIIQAFRTGAIRSTGDDPIDISVDHNSVALSINRERLEQVIQEVVQGTTITTRRVENARMR